ncbi:MAG TPA: hypothetical protein P5062_02845 [Methanothrix sp.]|nr:hypothetical protein [Methanothrix sp.]
MNLIYADEAVVFTDLGEKSKPKISGGNVSESAAQAGRMTEKEDININGIIADVVFMIAKNLIHCDKPFVWDKRQESKG